MSNENINIALLTEFIAINWAVFPHEIVGVCFIFYVSLSHKRDHLFYFPLETDSLTHS